MKLLNKRKNGQDNREREHVNKIKFIKDMKIGKTHLRQSLLDINEIEDMGKMFKEKKVFYEIGDRKIDLSKELVQNHSSDQEVQLTPFDRIQIYRKEKMNKHLGERMNRIIGEEKEVRGVVRIPKTKRMLQHFQDKYRKEMPLSNRQNLRESDQYLNMIKINAKKINTTRPDDQQPLYTSRMTQFTDRSNEKRFMSLTTSLPEKEKQTYPSLQYKIKEKKMKNQNKKPALNLNKFDAIFDQFLNKKTGIRARVTPKQSEQQFREHANTSHLRKRRTLVSQGQSIRSTKNQSRSLGGSEYQCMTRSEDSCKEVISTMTNFYATKHAKRAKFETMIENVKYDRPLTNSLRRKNYCVVGRSSLDPIEQLREISEWERRSIRSKNHKFYNQLIAGLDEYEEESIPTTVYIVEQIRKVFECQYMLSEIILRELISTVEQMDMDEKTEVILKKIGDFVGFKIDVIMPK